MAIQVIKDLRGLRIQVIHPPDDDGISLIEHLRRIGCAAEAQWPMPEAFAPGIDVAMLAIESERRDAIGRLLRSAGDDGPTLIAIVGYEDPSTLQIVLESEALAVVERPIRPFGLLTSLAIARSLHLERERGRRHARKLERKLAAIRTVQRAQEVLMAGQGVTEEVAYELIRKQAMSKRVPMEEIAKAIIQAHDVLTFRPGDGNSPSRGSRRNTGAGASRRSTSTVGPATTAPRADPEFAPNSDEGP